MFEPGFPAERMGRREDLADAPALYSDGKQADMILWGRDSQIVLLEIVNYYPGEFHPFPEVSALRTWEEWGLEILGDVA
jgi:hypothetical protein